MTLRVLQVIQEVSYGGAENVVATLVQRLREEGAHVAIAASGSAVGSLSDVEVTPLPLVERRLRRLPAAAFGVRRALRREHPDVVHAHNPGMGLVTALATLRGHTTPALVTMHGAPEEDYREAARALRFSGLPVIACGPGVAAALTEHGVEVAGTIVNGVAPAPRAADAETLRESLGLAHHLRLVVAVGRLVPQKNHALAVRSIASVPGAGLVVVGDGPLRPELTALVDSLGVADRVRFTGARGDARSLIGAADITLLTSVWEGLPLVVLEALAAGTPVVATDVRGVRELVSDGETALLAPAEDADALAAATRRVLGDDGLAARLRANGLALAARYGEDAMGDRYLALYTSLGRR
jgi:glycosyltransferase involved in cell wall biosynthesis